MRSAFILLLYVVKQQETDMKNFSFRAYHKDEKIMIPNQDQGFEGDVFNWLYQGQPIEVMQGTGLNDVNGKEIFEDDIVKWDDTSNGKYWRVAIVKMNPDLRFECFDCPAIENSSAHGHSFKFGNFIYTDTQNHLHIIGNTHENPELLVDV